MRAGISPARGVAQQLDPTPREPFQTQSRGRQPLVPPDAVRASLGEAGRGTTMKVLVLGAAGYVASAFRRAGHDVWGLVRSADEVHRLEIDETHAIVGNLQQPESYRVVADMCDVLVQTAMDNSSSTIAMGDARMSCSTSSAVLFTAARTSSCHLLAKEHSGRTPTISLTTFAGWWRTTIAKTASPSRNSCGIWCSAAPTTTVRWDDRGGQVPWVRVLGRSEPRASRATTLT